MRQIGFLLREIDVLRQYADRINDRASRSMPREEYESRHQQLQEDLHAMRDDIDTRLPRENFAEWQQGIVKELGALRDWRENVTGRLVVVSFVGALIVASIGALIGHLLGG